MRRRSWSAIKIRTSRTSLIGCVLIRRWWNSFGSIMLTKETMTVSVGKQAMPQKGTSAAKREIYESICRLSEWLEKNDYRGYDTFDGLNARYIRPLTFNNKYLRTVLQQGVRRFPINLRPILGIAKSHSTKGMGFIARGFMRLEKATGDPAWGKKARFALDWLIENQSPGYSGACWGNHFDYQSRSSYVLAGVPSI